MVVLAVSACRRGQLYAGGSVAKVTATFLTVVSFLFFSPLPAPVERRQTAWAKQARLPQRIDDDMDLSCSARGIITTPLELKLDHADWV